MHGSTSSFESHWRQSKVHLRKTPRAAMWGTCFWGSQGLQFTQSSRRGWQLELAMAGPGRNWPDSALFGVRSTWLGWICCGEQGSGQGPETLSPWPADWTLIHPALGEPGTLKVLGSNTKAKVTFFLFDFYISNISKHQKNSVINTC